MSEKMVDKVQEVNSSKCENLTIEIALQVDQKQKTILPGIGIDAVRIHAPIFISAYELRQMADEAEEYAKKQIKSK